MNNIKNFDHAYEELQHCLVEMRENLLPEEKWRAERLINFCRIINETFENDERFSAIYKPREKGSITMKEALKQTFTNTN